MKSFINGIISASGEQWLGFVFLSFLAGLASLCVVAVASDHKIDCYYTGKERTNAGIAYKIMADIDWATDIAVFSSGDKEEMSKMLSKFKVCSAAK